MVQMLFSGTYLTFLCSLTERHLMWMHTWQWKGTIHSRPLPNRADYYKALHKVVYNKTDLLAGGNEKTFGIFSSVFLVNNMWIFCASPGSADHDDDNHPPIVISAFISLADTFPPVQVFKNNLKGQKNSPTVAGDGTDITDQLRLKEITLNVIDFLQAKSGVVRGVFIWWAWRYE